MTIGQDGTVAVSLPFTGKWKVENSPLRRAPSHGTHLLATTYAIDFVGVDDAGRSAPAVTWRTAFVGENHGNVNLPAEEIREVVKCTALKRLTEPGRGDWPTKSGDT
ncbi:hypothetical protein QNO00_16870 [Arthrobacter sp. zg-Y1219]|uniref:hypothetical protein n=1 Tax=Arthrobacter sp. zg-Y1219 TaxID=3049067 RepID=UPI0024C35E62|nr:hypothetical protein [Arthrobacter sp. zg-Y1219]MDK1361926.1 hypothetical protein [Arthrobacter sp. zg-Y1219]